MGAVGGEKLAFCAFESGVELHNARIGFEILPVGEGFVASGRDCFLRKDAFPLFYGWDEERFRSFGTRCFGFVKKDTGVTSAGDLDDAGVGDFDEIVREFDTVFPILVFVTNGPEFVDAAEGGLVGRGDELGAHAPDIDAGSGGFKRADFIVVEVVAGDDLGVVEAGFVEELAGTDAEGGEVTGVEADPLEIVAFFAEFLPGLDRVTDAVEGVVGVDEKDGVVGHGVGVSVEGFRLAVEAHDPAVGVGSFDRDAIFHPGEDVGSGDAPSEVGGAARAHSSVGSLGAPESEFENGVAVSGVTKVGGFGGDEGLEVDDVEEGGFDELALEKRPANADDGLVGEGELAFGEGIDFELPIEPAEVVEIAVAEEGFVIASGEGGEVVEFSFGEGEAVEEVGGGTGAGHDGRFPPEGCMAVEEMEDGLAVGHLIFPVSITHRELVEVGEERRLGLHFFREVRSVVGRRRANPWTRTVVRNLRLRRRRPSIFCGRGIFMRCLGGGEVGWEACGLMR